MTVKNIYWAFMSRNVNFIKRISYFHLPTNEVLLPCITDKATEAQTLPNSMI